MTPLQHALLATALIDANGGVDACRKPTTRVDQSALYKYRDPASGAFMPADVIEVLEKRCANPLYSGMLFGLVEPPAPATDCVVQEAADVDEAGNDVWRFIRRTMGETPRPLTPNEHREAEALLQRLEREVAELRLILQLGGTNSGPST